MIDICRHISVDKMAAVEDRGTEVVAPDKGKELLEPKLSSRQAGDKEIGPGFNSHQAYPEALANYQDVVESKMLFMESLEKLHHAMETKHMIPTIGGKELDLHQLFVEVTARGGIEKVIGDRRWKEVTNIFNFPSSATNASFILRKYYISLLRHYEQIYFFRAKEWAPSAVSLNTAQASVFQPEKKIESAFALTEFQSATRKRRKCNEEVSLTAPLGQALPANRKVVGVIDGKFEDGYFVTVTVGTSKLKGVLFHASKQNAAQVQLALPGISNSNTRVTRRRRKRRLSSMDPSHPKPNRSGYNFFFAEHHAKLKLLHPGKDKALSRRIGDLWNNLTETERAVYQEIGLKDKQRYQSELAVYKEKQRSGLVLTNVVPIRQLPAEPSIQMQHLNVKETDDADKLSEDGVDVEEKSDEESEQQHSPEEGTFAAEYDMDADPSAFELPNTENDTEMASRSNVPSADNVELDMQSAETEQD